VTATANASGRSGLFGGASFGVRIDNSGSFNNGGSVIHGVDNTFVASYQKLSLNGSSLEFMTDYGTKLTIANSGAATFSSSVTAGSGRISVQGGNQNSILLNQNAGGTSTGYLIGRSYTSADTQDLFIYDIAAALPRFVISSAGNVGIGTASPGVLLHLSGSSGEKLRLETTASTPNFIALYTGATRTHYLGKGSGGSNDLYCGIDSSANIIFESNATERMRITSGGNVLIGQTTDNSDGKLQITTAGGNAIKVRQSSSGGYGIDIAAANNGGVYYFANFTAGATGGSITSNGTLVSYNSTSDYRLKEDLQEIQGLEKVQAIKVYNYKWKSEDSRMDGVLAHELAEVVPYAVVGKKDEVDEEGNDKMQGVDYSKIVPILIKAIQELKTEIDSLKNQIK
jgi:hypothetical protein